MTNTSTASHEQLVDTAGAVVTERKRGRRGVPAPDVTATASAAIDTLTGGDVPRIVNIPLGRIRPHPRNPRTDLGDLTELADSIRAHGVRQNALVVPDPDAPGSYLAVIGHRRHAASSLAGVTTLPSVVDDSLTPAEQLELMLVENLQRTDLTPVEEADGYQGLLDLGYTEAKIVKSTGRSRTTVRNRLRLGALPDKARKAVHRGKVTLDDALAIAELPAEEQDALAKKLGTNAFPQALAKVREQVTMQRNCAPLLDLLHAENVPELTRNGHETPDGMVYEADVNALHHLDHIAEAVEKYRGQITSGWAWRWSYVWLRLYRPLTLEEAQQRAERDEEQARVAAEHQAQRAVEAAAQAERAQFARLTAQTRREFIEHLVHDRKALTKDQQASVLSYAAFALIEEPFAGNYLDGVHRDHTVPLGARQIDALVDWLRVDLPNGLTRSYTRAELAAPVADRAARLTPAQAALAAFAAALEPIGEHTWEHAGRSLSTVRWYGLLEQLGYTLSDEERAALATPVGADEPVEGA